MTSTKTPAAAKERFGRGWVDSANDPDTGRWYGKYEFYQEDIDIIKAALEASPSSGLAEAVAKMRLIDADTDLLIGEWVRFRNAAIPFNDAVYNKAGAEIDIVIARLAANIKDCLKEQTGGSQASPTASGAEAKG